MKAGLFAIILIFFAGLASAQTIRVQAGEHDGFTRLVLNLPGATPWQIGRTADGYALRLDRPGLRFDLTEVFRVIPRTRLAAIWADPDSGNLRIGIGCACHAMPFEFRADVLVVDLRDGPSPEGSSFELAFDGGPQPALTSRATPRPRSRPIPALSTDKAAPFLLPFSGDLQLALGPQEPFSEIAPRLPDLAALRADLLRELGSAASAGVIDLETPVFPDTGATLPLGQIPGPYAHLTVGVTPGVAASVVNETKAGLTADGAHCLPTSDVDVASWGDSRPFDLQMAQARTALIGEFDKPDPVAVASLVRLNLYFGFGAEARAVIESFSLDDPSVPLWIEMAKVMDNGVAAPQGQLARQGACPGAVALWASLAASTLAAIDAPDPGAVLQGFSALPVHLRRYLGPGLAEKFLASGDLTSAQAIRDAIWRAPGDAGAAARVIDGQLDAARGNLAGAEQSFSGVAGQGGPQAARALVELVNVRVAQDQPVDSGTVTELSALVHEHKGGPLEPELARAEILARGSLGDYDTAFALARGRTGTVQGDLWALLARSGPDSALLGHAVLSPDDALPAIDQFARRQIGARLLDLGFADMALRWLPVDDADAATDTLLARAELARGDARTALRGLAGMTGPDVDRVRADALVQLGDLAAAAGAYADAGEDNARQSALWRAQDWMAAIAPDAQTDRATVGLLTQPPPLAASQNAPLAQGRALLADSAKTRDAILALLDARPAPPVANP